MLSWLTILLARLTRRHPSGPPAPVGWNGRPLGAAPQGVPSPDQAEPAADYSTLNRVAPRDGPKPTVPPPHPAG
jgi:hypothetical protein